MSNELVQGRQTLNKARNFSRLLHDRRASKKLSSLEVINVSMDGHANQWVVSQPVDLEGNRKSHFSVSVSKKSTDGLFTIPSNLEKAIVGSFFQEKGDFMCMEVLANIGVG